MRRRDACKDQADSTTNRARTIGGTVRIAEPNTSLSLALRAAAKVGISRIANVTGLDQVGSPTWTVVRPRARSLTVSQGKGISHELAKISGIMESVEIHHAEHFVTPGKQSSIAQAIRDSRYIPIDDLPLRSDAIADLHKPIDWVTFGNYRTGEASFVPRDLICLDYRHPRDPNSLFITTSNGLASGNSFEEALVHALCEIIERDQLSFWLAKCELEGRRQSTRVNLSSINHTECQKLLGRCFDAGLEVAVWYATTNFPLPTFVCAVIDPDGKTLFPQRASGSGAHPYKEIAFLRAVTEALQSRLTHIAGTRDDVTWAKYKKDLPTHTDANKKWTASVRIEKEFLEFQDIESACKMQFIEEILDSILQKIYSLDLSVLVLELTQKEIDVPVVRAVIPKLEHNARSPYYSPGPRMRDYLEGRT